MLFLSGLFLLLHVITLPCPPDIVLHHRSQGPLYRDTLLPLVAGDLRPPIIQEPPRLLVDVPPPRMVHVDHLLRGGEVSPNIVPLLEKKAGMREREHRLPRIGDMTGGMVCALSK